uniref:Uncharacterized protein n=1 Tax=Solanum tuberosum TaxID=4113 RepID=M1CSU4_SOLTU
MGSEVLQFLTSPALFNPLSSSLRYRFPLNNSTSNPTRCVSTSSGGRGGAGGRWHSNSKRPKDYQGFSWDDEIRANDKGEEFGFGGSTKQRIWWSGDPSTWGDEYDVEDEEAGIDGFGSMEGSIGFSWVMKETYAKVRSRGYDGEEELESGRRLEATFAEEGSLSSSDEILALP